MNSSNTIICPECGASINVSEILYQQLHDKIRREYETKHTKRDKEFEKKWKSLEEEKKIIEKEKESLKEKIDSEIQNGLKSEKTKLEKSIKAKIENEKAEELKELQKELNEKSDQLKDLNKSKAEIQRLKREKDELRDKILLEKETELSQKISEVKNEAKKKADEDNYLKIKEKEMIIEALKNQLDEAKRKAEQGSGQLKGEVQEIEIENMLRQSYPTDEIIEIKKGQRGADILQNVRNNLGMNCGKIYYESKRTQAFQNAWLQKLKDDNLAIKADILVLVTEALPTDVEKYTNRDGIWICTFNEVKGLSCVLRHAILKIFDVTCTQENKGSKMELLYNYLTSQEFKGQFEAILEGFKSLHDSYADEKLKMQKIWKEREKQLEKILSNAVGFYGSLKGIAGTSIPDIEMLEDGQKLLEH